MEFEIIATQRLKLRILTPEAYQYVFNCYPEEELRTFLGLPSEDLFIKEREKVRKGMTSHDRTFLLFQLLDRLDGHVIGKCGYHNWCLNDSRSEIGYVMTSEEDKGKGFMSEAMTVIVGHGFNKLNINRMEAFISPENTASLRLIRKLGFIPEGHLRQRYIRDGKPDDALIFALLKEDYDTTGSGQ